MVNEGKIKFGDKINVVVPTGNFGNILASYYASIMGLPINKFICASNSNNVLTDFIRTGIYDKNRHFYTTISPSMDILVSSNLERLLYMLSGNDDKTTKSWMNSLKSEGKYEVSDKVKSVIKEKFYGGYCDDVNTKATIHKIFEQDNISVILTQRLQLMYILSMLMKQATLPRLLLHQRQVLINSQNPCCRQLLPIVIFRITNLIWLISSTSLQVWQYLCLLQILKTKKFVSLMLPKLTKCLIMC